MEERLKKYITSLTEEERLVYCRKQISSVMSNFKSKEKAVKSELEYDGCRTGVRGGKRTTLSARAVNTTQLYFSSIEELRLIVSYL